MLRKKLPPSLTDKIFGRERNADTVDTPDEKTSLTGSRDESRAITLASSLVSGSLVKAGALTQHILDRTKSYARRSGITEPIDRESLVNEEGEQIQLFSDPEKNEEAFGRIVEYLKSNINQNKALKDVVRYVAQFCLNSEASHGEIIPIENVKALLSHPDVLTLMVEQTLANGEKRFRATSLQAMVETGPEAVMYKVGALRKRVGEKARDAIIQSSASDTFFSDYKAIKSVLDGYFEEFKENYNPEDPTKNLNNFIRAMRGLHATYQAKINQLMEEARQIGVDKDAGEVAGDRSHQEIKAEIDKLTKQRLQLEKFDIESWIKSKKREVALMLKCLIAKLVEDEYTSYCQRNPERFINDNLHRFINIDDSTESSERNAINLDLVALKEFYFQTSQKIHRGEKRPYKQDILKILNELIIPEECFPVRLNVKIIEDGDIAIRSVLVSEQKNLTNILKQIVTANLIDQEPRINIVTFLASPSTIPDEIQEDFRECYKSTGKCNGDNYRETCNDWPITSLGACAAGEDSGIEIGYSSDNNEKCDGPKHFSACQGVDQISMNNFNTCSNNSPANVLSQIHENRRDPESYHFHPATFATSDMYELNEAAYNRYLYKAYGQIPGRKKTVELIKKEHEAIFEEINEELRKWAEIVGMPESEMMTSHLVKKANSIAELLLVACTNRDPRVQFEARRKLELFYLDHDIRHNDSFAFIDKNRRLTMDAFKLDPAFVVLNRDNVYLNFTDSPEGIQNEVLSSSPLEDEDSKSIELIPINADGIKCYALRFEEDDPQKDDGKSFMRMKRIISQKEKSIRRGDYAETFTDLIGGLFVVDTIEDMENLAEYFNERFFTNGRIRKIKVTNIETDKFENHNKNPNANTSGEYREICLGGKIPLSNGEIEFHEEVEIIIVLKEDLAKQKSDFAKASHNLYRIKRVADPKFIQKIQPPELSPETYVSIPGPEYLPDGRNEVKLRETPETIRLKIANKAKSQGKIGSSF